MIGNVLGGPTSGQTSAQNNTKPAASRGFPPSANDVQVARGFPSSSANASSSSSANAKTSSSSTSQNVTTAPPQNVTTPRQQVANVPIKTSGLSVYDKLTIEANLGAQLAAAKRQWSKERILAQSVLEVEKERDQSQQRRRISEILNFYGDLSPRLGIPDQLKE